MTRQLVSIFILLLSAGAVSGQFTYRLDQSIPVEVNGAGITLPWAGGLNAAQFNKIDIDGDGDEDLVLFERTADKILTYINDNGQWRYAPEYESSFPKEVDQWMLLRDFNCDGRKDIFTTNIFGISVFVNITPPGGPLKWRTYSDGGALLTQGFTQEINLQINATDLIGIDDVDGDGDLDILDGRFSGIGSIEYHRNMSIERTGRCDSMQLVRVQQAWGNMEECNCGEVLFNSESDCSIFGGRSQHAAGKSVLTIDVDNDGDRDLLFTEETCQQTYFMQNTGTRDSAIFTNITTFPSQHPIVNFNLFPATYYEDVDFDGVPDLLVASNSYFRSYFIIDFQHSAWLYKNTGTATLPDFTFVKNNFLQDQMIEVGDNASPAFFDADADGDLDLFISSYNSANVSSYLYYYENTGTASAPSFRFVTSDYASLSRLLNYNMKIQFADMDADGKPDLVFTATSYSTNATSLFYVANKSSTGLDISNGTPVDVHFTPESGENLLVIDVNRDGLNDILLGRSTGALEYWQNDGPLGSFNYALKNGSYLGLTLTTARQNPVPVAGDLNSDGKMDLIIGDQNGALTIYSNFRETAVDTLRRIVWDTVSNSYISKNLGGRLWPVVANIFNSTLPSIIVGNLLGGLQVLKNDNSEPLSTEPYIRVFPNPATADKKFIIEPDRPVTAVMYSLFGVRTGEAIVLPAHQRSIIDCSRFASAVYILKITTGNKTYFYRMIIP